MLINRELRVDSFYTWQKDHYWLLVLTKHYLRRDSGHICHQICLSFMCAGQKGSSLHTSLVALGCQSLLVEWVNGTRLLSGDSAGSFRRKRTPWIGKNVKDMYESLALSAILYVSGSIFITTMILDLGHRKETEQGFILTHKLVLLDDVAWPLT